MRYDGAAGEWDWQEGEEEDRDVGKQSVNDRQPDNKKG